MLGKITVFIHMNGWPQVEHAVFMYVWILSRRGHCGESVSTCLHLVRQDLSRLYCWQGSQQSAMGPARKKYRRYFLASSSGVKYESNTRLKLGFTFGIEMLVLVVVSYMKRAF